MEYRLYLKYEVTCSDKMSHWTLAVGPTVDYPLAHSIAQRWLTRGRRWRGPSGEGGLIITLAARSFGDKQRYGANIRKNRANRLFKPTTY